MSATDRVSLSFRAFDEDVQHLLCVPVASRQQEQESTSPLCYLFLQEKRGEIQRDVDMKFSPLVRKQIQKYIDTAAAVQDSEKVMEGAKDVEEEDGIPGSDWVEISARQ